MTNCQEKVEDVLFTVGVPDLAKHIDNSRLDRVVEFGHPIDAELLSGILYSERGLNVFSNKDIRRDVLDKLLQDRPDFIDEINVDKSQDVNQALKQFNKFTWGDNPKSRYFLKLFNLDECPIVIAKKTVQPQEDVNIFKSLYPYQNWTRKNINDFFLDNNKSKLLVQMPTGSGKTRTMLESVCDHIRQNRYSKMSIVWLAHSEELCEQAVGSFQEIWSKLGSEDAQIIRLWGGMSPDDFEISRPTFVVTSFQTAYQMISTTSNDRFALFADIRLNCTLMVVDEAHQSVAPTYQTAIEMFSQRSTKIVGLTATPGRHGVEARNDEETIKLRNFYENNLVNIFSDDGEELDDPISYLKAKGVLSNAKHFTLSHDPNISLTDAEARKLEASLDIPESILKKLGEDVQRNIKIVTAALETSEINHKQTIIFAPSKESAIDIALFIRLQNGDARAIVGDTPTIDRLKHIEDFKNNNLKILVNYGVLTTGFDAPNIEAVIIARPTTSVVLYSQMLGRGLRGKKMGGTSECDIIDVHDNILRMPTSSNAYMFFNNYYTN